MDKVLTSRGLILCVLIILLMIGGLYVLNIRVLRQFAGEPTVLNPDNPILGHVPLFLRHGMQAFDILSKHNLHRFPNEIFTVAIPGFRFYIITSPDLIVSIQNKQRYVSNDPLFTLATVRWAGIKGDGAKKIFKDLGNHEVDSFTSDSHKQILKALGAGSGLDGMRKAYIARSHSLINSLADEIPADGAANVDLWKYLRRSVLVAGSTAVWGPSNPFEVHAELWRVFWTFENDLKYITNGVAFGRKGPKAQARLSRAFLEYHRTKEALQLASPLGKTRWAIARKYGLSADDIARLDIPATVGQSTNTIMATYAFLAYLLHDDDLLKRVRQELDMMVTREAGHEVRFDASYLRQQCPLFLSTLYEVMRHVSIGNTVRTIIEDFPLTVGEGEQYVLRKGSYIILAGGMVHNTSEFWPPDATTFDPERFSKYSSPETQIPGLFRAFGGGAGICKGRTLVVSEILATVGELLVRFDFDDNDHGEKLVLPDRQNIGWGSVMPKPQGNTIIKMRVRRDFEKCVWRVK